MDRKALIQQIAAGLPYYSQAVNQIETARRRDVDLPFYDAAIQHVQEARDLFIDLQLIALDLAAEADELEQKVAELEGRLNVKKHL
jgi:uncharacterized protein (DUF305 family)